MKVILIAHDQLELTKQGIQVLQMFSDIENEDIIIVDNASTDHLSEWLSEQTIFSYLICDEGIVNYASIINSAVRDFEIQEDFLILTPNHIALPNAVERMHQLLKSEDQIGAVSASLLLSDLSMGKDYNAALAYVERHADRLSNVLPTQQLGLCEGLLLIKAAMWNDVGPLDEALTLPQNVILDFCFRGLKLGWRLYGSESASFFAIENKVTGYEAFNHEADKVHLREKWGYKLFLYPRQPHAARKDFSQREFGNFFGLGNRM